MISPGRVKIKNKLLLYNYMFAFYTFLPSLYYCLLKFIPLIIV